MKRSMLAAGAVLIGCGASLASAQDSYVIGVSAAMTGPQAGTYAPVVDALKGYLDHVNSRGGVNGKQIRLVIQDNQGEPSKAAADAKKLVSQDKVLMMINTSLSSTYAPMVAESKRAGVPLFYAGAVCPNETFPPADPLQFCSTAFSASLDSQAAIHFVKTQSKEPVRIGFAAMAIPVARAGIEHAETVAKAAGMTVVEKQITPPPAPDYTPFATKLKEGNPNWMFSWSPWLSQVRTFEAMRRIGWNGGYVTWAHNNAEDELARLKDPNFYVIGTNALFADEVPTHAEIRAAMHRANLKYPVTYATEGFIAGLVIEQVLKNTPWPATPQKTLAAMNNVKVDLKGLRGGPLEWTKDNHFRTKQYYRVWRWDTAKNGVVRVQDWHTIDVKK